jgi:sugar phosphate isomerase/epimerase
MATHSTARTLLRRFAVSLYGAPPGYPVAAFCALLAARGIGGIGLTPDAVSMMEPDGLASLLARHDLRASSLNSAGYLLHADAQAAAIQERLEARLFDAAVALDTPVNVIPGGLLHAGPRLDSIHAACAP